MNIPALMVAALALGLMSAPPTAEAGRLKSLAKITKESIKYNNDMLFRQLPRFAKRDGMKSVKDLAKMSIGTNKVYLKCAIDPALAAPWTCPK